MSIGEVRNADRPVNYQFHFFPPAQWAFQCSVYPSHPAANQPSVNCRSLQSFTTATTWIISHCRNHERDHVELCSQSLTFFLPRLNLTPTSLLPWLSSPHFDKLHKIYIYVLILSIFSHTKQDIPSFWGAAFILLLLGYVRAPMQFSLLSFKQFILPLLLLFKEGSFHLIVYFVFMYSINWAKLKLYKVSTSYKTNIRISLVILLKSHLCCLFSKTDMLSDCTKWICRIQTRAGK